MKINNLLEIILIYKILVKKNYCKDFLSVVIISLKWYRIFKWFRVYKFFGILKEIIFEFLNKYMWR